MNGNVSRKSLKTSYRASPRSLQPLYTGGPVLLAHDGEWLITTLEEEVLITDVQTGQGIARVRGDGTAITSLALSHHTSPPTLVTSHLSTTIRFYPIPSTSELLSTSVPYLTYSRQLLKAHSAPILVSTVSPDSTLVATGSSDGIVKVWDSEGGYVTHIYRGHGGPVSALKFYFSENKSRMELFTGSTDGKVRIFDLKDASARVVGGGGAAKAKAVLEGHVSVVRGIDVSEDGIYVVTGGRDKVVLVWDLSQMSGETKKGKGKAVGPKVIQTIIAQEQVEALGLIPTDTEVGGSEKGRLLCYTGGDKGLLRVWDVRKAQEVVLMRGLEGVDEDEDEDDEQRGIISVLFDESSSSLVSVHADQNIIYHSLSSGQPTRQLIGFNDEIIDATFLSATSSSSSSSMPSSSHSHLALATNSSLIRLYSTDTFDARLLIGHKDMVLCLDKTPDYKWLVSGAKDQTARIWTNVDGSWKCVAICEGHAESIGAVAFSRRLDDKSNRPKFLITASQDRTIKLWDLSVLHTSDLCEAAASVLKPRSLATLRAHEKDINSLDISPNDRFLVSGSQDKLVKVFEIDYSLSSAGPSGALKLSGTCKGHRRGVWTVKFSRNDKIIASGAADRTVKLWSLDDFTCLKTFEGHTNSVLRVDFISNGQQLVTSSSDGLVKLWNIKDEECIKTLNNHEDKVWALAISADEKTIVSAGADSIATFWEDATEVEQAEKNEALVKAVQSEQDFTNYVALKDYRKAIKLALAMSQPGRLLHLFTTVLSNSTNNPEESYTGSRDVDEVIRTLSGLDLARLLGHIRNWNVNARTASIAQTILHAILRLKSPEEIIKAYEIANTVNAKSNAESAEDQEGEDGEGGQRRKNKQPQLDLKDLLDGLIPYSERHFARVDRLVQDSYVLDYVVGEMDGGLFGGEVMDVDGVEA